MNLDQHEISQLEGKGSGKTTANHLGKGKGNGLGKGKGKGAKEKGWPSRTRSLMMKQMSLKRRLTKMP